VSQRRYGATLSYVSIFVNVVTGLAFTPFLVRSLGQAEYGLYSLVGAFAGYLAILDLGISDSVVRFVARYRARHDREGEQDFLGFITVLYVAISLLVLAGGVVIFYYLPALFKSSLTPHEVALARSMFVVLLVNITATILLNPLSAMMVAHERFVLLRTIEIVSGIAGTLATCALLLLGGRSLAVTVVATGVSFAVLLVKAGYAVSRLGFRFRPRLPGWPMAREVAFFAVSLFVVVLVEQIYWKLDNVIIGVMVNASAVAVYSIGMSFHKYFMSFSTAVSKVMMPRVVQRVEAGAGGHELTDLLIKVSRIQAIVLMLILTGLVAFGREFIELWVGPPYRTAYAIMLVTLVPFSLELVGNVRNQIMQAKNIYWHRSYIVFVISLANVAATVLLVGRMGILGAAIATGGGICLGYIAVNAVLWAKAGIEVGRYHRELASGIAPAALLSLATGVLLNEMGHSSWLMLCVRIACFTLVYLLALWTVGMNEYEKALVRDLVRTARRAPRRAAPATVAAIEG
jgi:O-antigen/teichoic acid export membrane protein